MSDTPWLEARGLYLASTSVCGFPHFSFIDRYITKLTLGIGRSDKTPVLTQNLPDEQRFTNCVVLPGPSYPEPDEAKLLKLCFNNFGRGGNRLSLEAYACV